MWLASCKCAKLAQSIFLLSDRDIDCRADFYFHLLHNLLGGNQFPKNQFYGLLVIIFPQKVTIHPRLVQISSTMNFDPPKYVNLSASCIYALLVVKSTSVQKFKGRREIKPILAMPTFWKCLVQQPLPKQQNHNHPCFPSPSNHPNDSYIVNFKESRLGPLRLRATSKGKHAPSVFFLAILSGILPQSSLPASTYRGCSKIMSAKF